jgi:Ran GTPase-activating protein (RanGAP) involved in mRNA processing and transport
LFDLNTNNENEISELKTTITNKQTEIDKLTQDIELLKSDNKTEVLDNEIKQLKDNEVKLLAKIEGHENEITEFKDNEAKFISKTETLQNKIKQLECREAATLSKIEELENELKNLRNEKEELKKELSKGEELKKALADIKVEFQKEKNDNRELKEIITKDQLKLKDLNLHKDNFDKNNQEILAENKKLKVDLDLTNEIKTKTKLELEDCKSKLELSQMNLNTLNEEKSKLRIDIDESLSKIKDLETKFNELEDKYSAKLAEAQKLSEELAKLHEENLIKKKGSENTRNSARLSSTFDDLFLSKDLIIDHLYTLYIHEQSVSLQTIIRHLLSNYNLFLNTIFISRQGTNSYSFIHEFLEDLFFKLYDTGIYSKFKRTADFKDLWLLSSSEFNGDMIKDVCQEYLSTNSFNFLNNILTTPKSIDDMIQVFISTYQKQYNIKGFDLGEYINREVKPKIIEKIERNKKSLLTELQTLVEFSVTHINEGKIVHMNKEIYNFKNFYLDGMVEDIRRKKLLNIDYNFSSIDVIDNLLFSLRYKAKDLENLYFNNNIDAGSESSLMKVIMTILFQIPSIKSIAITNSMLNENNMINLTKLIEYSKNLKSLNISNNVIYDEGVRMLCEYLKNNKTIISLNLSNNKLEQNNGFYIADMLMKNNAIESLYLSGNLINDSGLGSLLTVITNNNHNIRVLDISYNQLLVDDYAPISDAIVKNNNLFSLNLSGNEIFSKTTNILGHAIKSSNLGVLYMNDMKIDENSFPLLIKNLNESKITVIHFDSNMIGDVVVILGNILKSNTTLKVLSLRDCSISPMSLFCLCKALEVSNTLEEVRLEENTFDEMTLSVLFKSVKDKPMKVYISASTLNEQSKDMLKGINNIIII